MSSSSRRNREEKIVERREKQHQHQQYWDNQQKYYERQVQSNSRFDAWTSPRYYESNNQLRQELNQEKMQRLRNELRRKRLRELFEQERVSNAIELMAHKAKNSQSPRSRADDIPTEILKEIHSDIKQDRERKQRDEAEKKLYQQWRITSPFIRDSDAQLQTRNLKMCWLDQQVEKRMKKEKEEEENKRLQKEHEERLRELQSKDELAKVNVERRNRDLKEVIDKQVEEMLQRQRITEDLTQKYDEEHRERMEIAKLEEEHRQFEKTKKNKELALYNIRMYKNKIKQRAQDIRDNLQQEEALMEKIKEMELTDKIADENVKADVKKGVEEFLAIIREQKELERTREGHLQFLFDSEARNVYAKQSMIWEQEENARSKLVREVLDTVGKQIEENGRRNLEKQKELLRERELLLRTTEEYDEELKRLEQEEERKKRERKREIDEQIKSKKDAQKTDDHNAKLKRIEEELEKARVEEERLKREIMHLHRGQGTCRPSPRSNIIF